MTDLINKINNLNDDYFTEINKKYSKPLEVVANNKKKYTAYLIDKSVSYLNTNHKNQNGYIKTWAVVAVNRLFENNLIKSDEDINNKIDRFINYWQDNFKDFSTQNHFKSDYYLHSGFVHEFVYDVKEKKL